MSRQETYPLFKYKKADDIICRSTYKTRSATYSEPSCPRRIRPIKIRSSHLHATNFRLPDRRIPSGKEAEALLAEHAWGPPHIRTEARRTLQENPSRDQSFSTRYSLKVKDFFSESLALAFASTPACVATSTTFVSKSLFMFAGFMYFHAGRASSDLAPPKERIRRLQIAIPKKWASPVVSQYRCCRDYQLANHQSGQRSFIKQFTVPPDRTPIEAVTCIAEKPVIDICHGLVGVRFGAWMVMRSGKLKPDANTAGPTQ